MAGISKKKYRTKKGIVTRYVITYRDIFGKQRTYGNFETKTEALKNIPKFEKKKVCDKNITVGRVLDIYLEACKKRNRAANTIRDYELYKDKYLQAYKELKCSKITTLDWQEIIYKLEKDYSIYAAIGCHRLLRAAFNYALKYKLINSNNFTSVEVSKPPEHKYNHFEVEELLNLLEVCKSKFPEYYALLFTFIGTGMREGEIFGLTKENIDFKKNKIRVCAQYTNREFKKHTKTKQARDVYIFPTLAHILKEHIKNDKLDCDLVFHNSAGGFLNPSNIRQRFWIKLLKECGYPEDYARLHDLRGSNTDMTIASGLSITFAKDQLGHTNELTTLRNYAKTNKAMIENGIDKFEAIFEKCEQNVSIKEKEQKSNVIQFPRKQSYC